MRKLSQRQIWILISLFLLTIIIQFLVVLWRQTPGYMDESYYFLGGRNLIAGNGFFENIIWNYLGEPEGLPHPSHLYWMPLNSIIVWVGMVIFHSTSYIAGSSGFIFLSGLIPVITYLVGKKFTENKFLPFLMALFSIFSGYYFSMISTIDSFAVYMLLGTAYLFIVGFISVNQIRGYIFKGIILGLLAGLMHLTRADGILWIVVLPCAMFVEAWQGGNLADKTQRFGLLFAILGGFIGYWLIMMPWFLRNIELFGSLTAPGASLTLWQRSYNELYSYPAALLNFKHWISEGIFEIIQTGFNALWKNLGSFLGVQCFVILIPFVIGAGWKRRKQWGIQFCFFMWSMILFVMSFVFPFAGARGGYFHSASAFQIFIWVLGGLGIYDALQWMEDHHTWNAKKSSKVFGMGLVIVFVLSTFVMTFSKIQGEEINGTAWSKDFRDAELIETDLTQLGIALTSPIIINDPATYNIATERSCYVIPNGDVNTLLLVMKRYDIDYMVLQKNHPEGLINLYLNPEDELRLNLISKDEEFGYMIFKKAAE